MDIFVIHSGPDHTKIRERIDSLDIPQLNYVLMNSTKPFWKQEAHKLIKEAQLILYVPTEDSGRNRNILWELKKAAKHNKIVYAITDTVERSLHVDLKRKNPFTGENEGCDYDIISYEDLKDIVQEYKTTNYDLFRMDFSELPNATGDEKNRIEIYMEQYKLFVQTSEDLVKRRQDVNSFYMSIHSALVAFMGVLFALKLELTFLTLFGIIFCLAGIIMSWSWRNMLTSYGQLNSAKMKIIGMMEERLPLSLFDAEWRILDDPMSKKRYKSFTQYEKWIPFWFMLLYTALILALVLMVSGVFGSVNISNAEQATALWLLNRI